MNTTTTIEKMIDSIAAVCIDLGLRGGYTPEEITNLVCDIALAHMYDALRDRAETVYAYSTDGDRSMTLKYRSRKLFDREAMLLWREPVVCVDETEVASSRYLELWLLEDMSVAVVSCVQIVFTGFFCSIIMESMVSSFSSPIWLSFFILCAWDSDGVACSLLMVSTSSSCSCSERAAS